MIKPGHHHHIGKKKKKKKKGKGVMAVVTYFVFVNCFVVVFVVIALKNCNWLS